jgi:hypothetical protein
MLANLVMLELLVDLVLLVLLDLLRARLLQHLEMLK